MSRSTPPQPSPEPREEPEDRSCAEGSLAGCLATRQVLAESYGRYRTLANATFEALLIHDQGIILEVNDAFVSLFGFEREDLIDRSILSFLPAAPPKLMESLRTPLTSLDQTIGPYELDLPTRTGETLIMEVRIKALPYHGKLVRVVAFRNVTESRKLERAKQEFVSVISHELRCPLGSLHNSLEILASGRLGDLPPRARRMIELASQASSRLIRLANQTLDYERLSSGHLALHLSDCSAADLLQQAADTVGGLADAAGIALAVAAEPLSLRADADRIIQVLVNLLSNALKVAPAGSTIDLRAERSEGGVRFEVHDHGPGIPPEHQEAIFERFKQFAPASSARSGIGLGLAICRELIARHGGRISVESRPGEGSTFHFVLPSPEASPSVRG